MLLYLEYSIHNKYQVKSVSDERKDSFNEAETNFFHKQLSIEHAV